MTSRYLVVALGVLGIGLALLLWSARPQNTGDSDDFQVVASVYPLADFARQVAGEHALVSSVVPGGVEPHEFEPTPGTVTGLLEADVLVYIGGDFDLWAEELVDEVRGNGGEVVAVEDIVELASGGDEHEGLDPHVWLDPVLSQAIVSAIQEALAEADPVNAPAYAANAREFIQSLERLDSSYAESLSECDLNDIIVSHNAYSYLGRRYEFKIHGIAGLSPENEPSLNDLASLTAEAEELGVKTVFFETLVSPELAQTLADEIGAETAVLNPIEGLSQEEEVAGDNYLTIMERNRSALAEAMLCQ